MSYKFCEVCIYKSWNNCWRHFAGISGCDIIQIFLLVINLQHCYSTLLMMILSLWIIEMSDVIYYNCCCFNISLLVSCKHLILYDLFMLTYFYIFLATATMEQNFRCWNSHQHIYGACTCFFFIYIYTYACVTCCICAIIIILYFRKDFI